MKKFPYFKQFNDYHEITYFNSQLKELGTGLKCKELIIDYDYYDLGPYLAMIYKGRLSDKGNRKGLKDFKEKHYKGFI